MLEDQTSRVDIDIAEDQLRRFFPLLGGGFDILTEVDLTVSAWFCSQPGLATDYLKNRIQTIFLDGKAVDDPEKAIVKDGSTLALSAAMPGLVGATFRKGGRYAALRCEISHSREKASGKRITGLLTLKLFNMVAAEIGPVFLRQAVRVNGRALAVFLDRLPTFFWRGGPNIRLDGKALPTSDFSPQIIEKKYIWLKVTPS